MIDCESFVLAVLNEFGGSFESATRLQKLAFLSIYENRIPHFTEFRWYRYGPYSIDLTNAVNSLHERGLINIEDIQGVSRFGDEYTVRRISFTERGSHQLPKLVQLDSDEIISLRKTIRQYGHQNLSDLLGYVYGAYSPEDL